MAGGSAAAAHVGRQGRGVTAQTSVSTCADDVMSSASTHTERADACVERRIVRWHPERCCEREVDRVLHPRAREGKCVEEGDRERERKRET